MARNAPGGKALDSGEGEGSVIERATRSRSNTAYTYGVSRGTKRTAVREKQTEAFKMFRGQKGTQVFYRGVEVGAARSKGKPISPKSFREGIEQ